VSAIRRWFRVLGRAAAQWYDDDAHQLGAALAYYSLFSVTPLLIIAMAIAGVAFDPDEVRALLQERLGEAVGAGTARTLLDLAQARMDRADGFWAAAIAGGALVVLSVGLFVELRIALARVWKGESRQGPTGIARVLRAYSIAVLMVIGAGVLLVGLLALSTALSALEGIGAVLPGTASLLRAFKILVSIGVAAAVFALVFRVMSYFRWRSVWAGALAAALLYALGNTLFGFYVELSGVRSGYGAAGALVVFLVWVYYTAQIFIFGAEVVAADASLPRR
jgi:membrane protein